MSEYSAYIEERQLSDGWACVLVVKIPLEQATQREYAMRASQEKQAVILDRLKGIISGEFVSINDVPEEMLTSMMLHQARFSKADKDRIAAIRYLTEQKQHAMTKEFKTDLLKNLDKLEEMLGEQGRQLKQITLEALGIDGG